MKGLDETLEYKVEGLSANLKENLHARAALKEIAEVISEFSMLIAEESERRINTRELK